jgi:hypothetical protein
LELISVTNREYSNLVPSILHSFNSVEFSELNKDKVDEIYYLIFKDSKIRLSMIVGIIDRKVKSPFSAPFGGFNFVSEDIKLSQIQEALLALDNWMVEKGFQNITLSLPPFFYNQNYFTKLSNSFFLAGYSLLYQDINYQFQTSKADEKYEELIWKNARKNLRKSNSFKLTFEKLEEKNGETAYEAIRINRMEKNIPLRMTWDQVRETSKLIQTDFFVVKTEELILAGAVVFYVTPDIVQVIYWGDLPAYSEFKTMNYLSYNIFIYYKKLGVKYVDIGISTELSVPNHGLCEFKESIGCDLSLKFTFSKTF